MRAAKIVIAGLVIVLFTASCNKYNKIFKSTDYDYKLKMADEFYDHKRYKVAQQLYEELFPVFKGTEKFEQLYYKDAYCFYYMKDYMQAQALYKGFLEVFPNSAKAEEVDYMHAYCFFKQSPKVELEQVNTIKAIGMMQTFINTHPGSTRLKEATDIIDQCRQKLEQKEYRSAELYFNLGQYRAAALAFANLMNDYPESVRGDEYKLKIVKAYYRFAKLSFEDKQIERYEKVITEFQDFADRFPDSKLFKEAESYSNLSQNHIKEIKNEQTTSSAKQ
ncbi:MAG: outer membrane protein assembly factor BamD [Bacteroidetes bacterium]|nr:outer membrane protein assembly factor BamD [Bacteroidota bacterium]